MFKIDLKEDLRKTMERKKIRDQELKKISPILNIFFPKFSEIDSYILLLQIISLLFFSESFRLPLLFTGLILAPGLIIGTYYSFNIKKIASQTLQYFIVSSNVMFINGLSIIAVILFGSKLGLDGHSIIVTFFFWFNLIRSAINLLIITSGVENPQEFLFSNKDAKLNQIIIITALVPLLVFVFLQDLHSSKGIIFTSISIYSIVSLIVHSNFFDITKNIKKK